MTHDVRKSLLLWPLWPGELQCATAFHWHRFFSVGSHLLVRFGGYPPLRMWLSAVGEGPCSIKIFQVHDRRAIRRLLTPPPVRSLSHDPCSRTNNSLSTLWTARKVICWYASFSTHLHCSSRDSLTCEHMVRTWCDIAFLTEHIRNRSP